MAEVGDALIVDDGSAVWFYLRKSNQYGARVRMRSQLTLTTRGGPDRFGGYKSREAMDYLP